MEKKRTKQEIDEAVKNGDYTGGYKTFFAWLIYMRLWAVFYFVGFLLLSILNVIKANYWYTVVIVLMIAAVLIKLKDEFRDLKKGIIK